MRARRPPRVFDNARRHDEDEVSYGRHLARITAAPPMFFAIDDDMKDPSEDDTAFHGRWVRKLMRTLAPAAAPWELDGGSGGED